MSQTADLSALYRRDLIRLTQQIEATPPEMLWATRPGVSNSIGNLALHLDGNLRDFIGNTLGGVGFIRQREQEFSTKGLSAAEVLERVRPLQDLIPGVIDNLTSEALEAVYPKNALGKPVSTNAFLIHLSGHLNYHLGQIDYLRRVLSGDSAIQLAGL